MDDVVIDKCTRTNATCQKSALPDKFEKIGMIDPNEKKDLDKENENRRSSATKYSCKGRALVMPVAFVTRPGPHKKSKLLKQQHLVKLTLSLHEKRPCKSEKLCSVKSKPSNLHITCTHLL